MKPYDRLSQHKLRNLEVAEHFNNIAQLIFEREEDNKAIESYYRSEGKKASRLSDFALDYLIENNFEACNSCDYPGCYLVENISVDNTECGRIGIKILAEETIESFSKKRNKYTEPTLLFTIEKINRYNLVDVDEYTTIYAPFIDDLVKDKRILDI
ncbi:MAG: hypothetical protein ACP5N1_02835 [Candidatus Woesearchaeota archaeon]